MHRTDQSSRSKPNPARLSGSGRRGIGGAADAPPLTASGVTVTPAPPTDQSGDLRPKSPLEQQLTRLLGNSGMNLETEPLDQLAKSQIEKRNKKTPDSGKKMDKREEEELEWHKEQERRRLLTVEDYLHYTGQGALVNQKGTLTIAQKKNNNDDDDLMNKMISLRSLLAWKQEVERTQNGDSAQWNLGASEKLGKGAMNGAKGRSVKRQDASVWFANVMKTPSETAYDRNMNRGGRFENGESSSGRLVSGREYTGGRDSGRPDYRGSSYGGPSSGRDYTGRRDAGREFSGGRDSGDFRYGAPAGGRSDTGRFSYGESSSGRRDSERNYTGGSSSGRTYNRGSSSGLPDYRGSSSEGRDFGRNHTVGRDSGRNYTGGPSSERFDSGRSYTGGRDSGRDYTGRPSSGRSGYSPRGGSHSDSQQTSSRRHEQRYKETPAEIYKKAYSEIKTAMEVLGQSMLDRYDALKEILSECPLRDLLSEGDYFSAEQCSKVEDLIARFRSFQDLKPRLVDLVRDLLRGVFNPRFLVLNVDFIMRFAASEHAEYHGSRRNRH